MRVQTCMTIMAAMSVPHFLTDLFHCLPLSQSTRLIVQGYKAQCKLVMERIEKLVSGCEARGESAVVEGVHLSIGAVIRLLAAHPCVVPFLVHISNESKHQERFAVRPCPFACNCYRHLCITPDTVRGIIRACCSQLSQTGS